MANPTAATLLTKTDAVRTTCQSFFLFIISYSPTNWNCNSTPKHANTKQLVHGTSGSATLVLVSIDVSAAMVKSTARRTPPTRPTAVSYCNWFNKIFNFLLVSCRDDWWETTTTVVRDSYDTRCPLFWPEGRWHTKRNETTHLLLLIWIEWITKCNLTSLLIIAFNLSLPCTARVCLLHNNNNSNSNYYFFSFAFALQHSLSR